MERISITPRIDWQAKVEALGFTWHTPDGNTYWNEGAYWKFSTADVEHIRGVVKDGYAMLLDAVAFVIENKQLPLFGFDANTIDLIEASWERRGREPMLYGRFDLAFDGKQARILEFQADNPGNLFETSMVQRYWITEALPGAAQMNSIHEMLVAQFRRIDLLNRSFLGDAPMHITTLTPNPEAEVNASYLQNIAQEAGVAAKFVGLGDIAWQEPESTDENGIFLDADGVQIQSLIKLAPLNWMLQDDFGGHMIDLSIDNELQIIEPAWKLVAQNKRIWATIWDRNQFHPALLNTATLLTPLIQTADDGYVTKPYNGLDGQNITMYTPGGGVVLDSTEGSFAEDQIIFQERALLPGVGGVGAVVSAWTVPDTLCGLSVREGVNPIVDSASMFLPHIVAD
jgi:glutathionylspermidine synthase